MSTVLHLTGLSDNDAVAAAGRAHRKLFEDFGYDFEIVNFGDPNARDQINEVIAHGGIELCYGTVGVGAGLRGTRPDGTEANLWAALRVPFISLLADSPAYFFDRHVPISAWNACVYYFPEHLAFRQRLPRPAALMGTVPPIPFDYTDPKLVDFRKKAEGTLLFLKNGNDPEALVQLWRRSLPSSAFLAIAEIASDLSQSIASDVGSDIDKLVVSYFATRNWDIDKFVDFRLFFVAQLDDYLRRVKSQMVASVLADFPVEIHGKNWEHMNFSGRKARYFPGGDYTDSGWRIRESLGVVDMSPNTDLAPHDRAMRAFGMSTLCVTNCQKYFTENFTNSEDFTYRFEPDALRSKIDEILSNPKRSVEIGIAQAQQFNARHTQQDFPRFMVDTAALIRLSCGPRPSDMQEFFVWPPTR